MSRRADEAYRVRGDSSLLLAEDERARRRSFVKESVLELEPVSRLAALRDCEFCALLAVLFVAVAYIVARVL